MAVTASYRREMVGKPSKVSFSPARVRLLMGVSTTAVPHAATWLGLGLG